MIKDPPVPATTDSSLSEIVTRKEDRFRGFPGDPMLCKVYFDKV